VKLQNLHPEEFLRMARPSLGIPEGANGRPDNSLIIGIDEFGKRLLVTGKPDAVDDLKRVIAKLDTSDKPGGIEASPQFEQYDLAGFDPVLMQQILESKLIDIADKKIAIDPKQGVIFLDTIPEGHKRVKALLDGIQKGGCVVNVFNVKSDPQALMLAINKLFGVGDPAQPGSLRVEADATAMQLMMVGPKAKVEQIRKFLEEKKELIGPPEEYGPTVRSKRRTISVPGSTAQDRILSSLESELRARRVNFKINDSRPKVEQGTGANSGFDQRGFNPPGGDPGFFGPGGARPGYGAPG
jgi:hypothetical protein